MRGPTVVLLVALLAGCASPTIAPATLPDLTWGPMSLETVPLEPLEARGILQLTWEGGRMAVHTEREGGMPAQAIVDGDVLYTTQTGMGWTRWSLPDYVAQQARGFRYLAWNAPELLATAQVAEATDGQVVAATTFRLAGRDVEAVLEIDHDGPAVREVRIRTPADPEAPFTLRPLGQPFPFAVEVPAEARPDDEVQQLNSRAREGHVAILGWIKQYRTQLGNLPQDVSSQGLALQRLNQPWPTSPYDDQPMRNEAASGHFQWDWCSGQDASFHGYGWDGAPLNEDFGRGCRPVALATKEL